MIRRKSLTFVLALLWLALPSCKTFADENLDGAIEQSLDYLAGLQKRQGYWEANGGQYRVAMTALAGTAMLSEGSTTTAGKYSRQIRLAVDYLLSMG